MVARCGLVVVACALLFTVWAQPGEERLGQDLSSQTLENVEGWKRIDTRYCTIWIDPSVDTRKLNRRIRTWFIRPKIRAVKSESPEDQLTAKCDTLFRRAEELLDMYPPGVRVTLKIARTQEEVQNFHAAHYGVDTEALAFYVFENNTIYTVAKELSASVLAHEMAHCIIDHYFGVRPPRKVEELLATYVDVHLWD